MLIFKGDTVKVSDSTLDELNRTNQAKVTGNKHYITLQGRAFKLEIIR